MIKRITKTIFPPGSWGFILLKRIAIFLRLTPALPLHELQYSDWTKRVEVSNWSPQKELKYMPLISIVVPVFNPPAAHFLPMVYSVVNQTYPNWQLVLVNASTNKKGRELTSQAAHIDKRILVLDMPDNLGIAGNTNKGIEQAEGGYIAFLDHDDTLAFQALYEIALVLQDQNKPQLIYSDEDKLTNNGIYRVDPHFKPDWSPQLLRELNYINHFTVIEENLLKKVGGSRSGFDGAQDYDLFLRIIDESPLVAHVPKILYHWRTAKTSTSENFSQKKNVLDAGIRALEDHLKRNGQQGKAIPVKDQPGFYKIEYKHHEDTKITILVLPSQLQGEYRKFLYLFLRNVEKTNQKADIFVQNLRVPIKKISPNIKLHYIGKKDRKEFIEEALKSIDTELSLIVGCGLSTIGKTWLTSLVGLMTQVKSVAIGAPFIFAGDRETIIDAGQVRLNGGYLPLFQGYPDDQHTPFGNSNWARNVDAVNARCFMIQTQLLKTSTDQLKANGPLLFTKAFFDQLQIDHKQIVTWPFSRLVYLGEMTLPDQNEGKFNSNLAVTKTEFSTFEAISVARDYRDE